jgi:hypothetical protein
MARLQNPHEKVTAFLPYAHVNISAFAANEAVWATRLVAMSNADATTYNKPAFVWR